MSRLRRLLPPAAAVLALALPAPAEARRTVPQGWLGAVATNGTLLGDPGVLDRETKEMVASGVEAIRVPVYWNAVQPYRRMADVPADRRADYSDGNGVPTDLRAFDAIFAAAVQRRIRVLPVVLAAPGWAAQGNRGRISGPRKASDYTRFLTTLVRRYGPNGAFFREHPELAYRPQRSWQIWNEPDHENFWRRPWIRDYVKLMHASYRTLKRLDRRSTVVLGGLTGKSWSGLYNLYKAGLKGAYDVAAIHPYTAQPKNVLKTVQFVRRVMHKNHDDRRPIVLTELSWPASRGKVPRDRQVTFAVDPRTQARRLTDSLRLLSRNRRALRIQAVYWFTWASSYAGTNPWEYSGLRKLSDDGGATATPALRAFRTVGLGLEGRRR